MSASGGGSGDSFRGLLLQLRGRIGLTQRELASRLDVHAHSIQAWEAGTSYPGAASLRALIAAAVQAGGFTPGSEVAEASALWSAAMHESSRLRTPFDRTWFDTLLLPTRATERPSTTVEAAVADVRAFEPRRHSWGEAPDVASFVGRVEECGRLRRWVLDELPASCGGYSVETAINFIVDAHGGSTCVISLRGASFRRKASKAGVLRGWLQDLGMVRQMVRAQRALEETAGESCQAAER